MFLKSIIILLQALPDFTFANQAGLDMLETTLVSLQDITLDKIFDASGRTSVCSELPQILQQVTFASKFTKRYCLRACFTI